LHDAGAPTLAAVVALILDRQVHDHAPPGAGVTLASLHAAKGLEWDAVFLAGMSDGLMPISLAETPAQLAEEGRLLYVGITRARQHLTLTFAKARTAGGAASRAPSRFLAGLWPEADGADAQPRTRSVCRRSAAGSASPVDEGSLTAAEAARHARLMSWRTVEAKSASVPAYTILPDVSLRALARHNPTSLKELAALRGIGPVKLARYGTAILEVLNLGPLA
jgi:DNA helicase-2/ATP-dependent DNA helicase PcrA